MARFRKKPVEIAACQYNEQHESYRPDWFTDAVAAGKIVTYPDGALILLPEGRLPRSPLHANLGDWVIRYKGEFFICKPDIFDKTYEPAD